MSGLVAAAVFVAILLPSANYQLFDGVPLSTLPEACAALFLLTALASTSLRRPLLAFLDRRPPLRSILLGIVILALAAKVLLYLSETAVGLPGCYTTTVAPPPSGVCEASYENPRLRFNSTRVDRTIEFDQATWNLSFLNSGRFNFLLPGQPRRDRLPLSVDWLGQLRWPEGGRLELMYTGEARVAIGPVHLDLEPSYARTTAVSAELPRGDHLVSIRYRFDDGSRVEAGGGGPYALFKLRFLGADGEPAEALLAAGEPPGNLLRAAALASDIALLALVFAVAAHVALSARSVVALALPAGAAAVWVAAGASPGIVPLVHLSGVAVLLVFMLWKRVPGVLAVSFLLCAVLAYARFSLAMPDPAFVFYRPAGDDWLAYESQARAILETGSLEGGEAVFYYQPLFRYVAFAAHFLLGDGDLLPSALFSTLFVFAVLYSISVAELGRRGSRWLAIAAAGLVLLSVAVSEGVASFIAFGASEGPTWILVPAGLTLVFLVRGHTAWVAGAGLLALASITRLNQLPVLLVFFVASVLLRRPRLPTRVAVCGVGVFCAVLLLPLAHNVYYGGEATLTTRSATIEQNLVVRPAHALAALYDEPTRRAVARQVGWLASTDPSAVTILQGQGLLPAFRLLQLGWALAAAWVLWRGPRWRLAVLAAPAIYFVVHVFYQVDVYYPRHLVVGYLTVGWAIAWSFAGVRESPVLEDVPEPGVSHPRTGSQ